MKNNRFLLTVFAILLLCASLVLASCNGDGEITTEAPEITDAPATDAPEVTSEEVTTEAAPDVTTDEITEEVTTEAPVDTTETPVETSEPPVETTETPSETTEAPVETSESLHTHSFGAWTAVKAATCTESGSEERVCSCGEKETRDVAALGHADGEWIVDKNASCTEEGSKHKVCAVCGETLSTEAISAVGHSEVVDPAVAATCTKDGLTAGKHCSVCNEVFEAQQKIPASGHKDGEWITDKEPTYTAEGSKHLVCAICGETIKTETVPALEMLKIEYSVTVLDSFGKPVSKVKISFMSGDSVAAEAVTDASGKATVKLAEGDYDAILEAEGESVRLTTSAPSAEIVLVSYASAPQYIYPGEQDTDKVLGGVYDVQVGSFRIPVEKGKIRYLFFAPTEGAIYHVYTDSDKVEVGYYGGSFYVTPSNTGVYDESGALVLEVLHSSVGNKLVLGLTSTSASVTECTVTIVRYSDIEIKDVERPWEQYVPTQVPDEQVKTPSGTMQYVPIEVNYSTMSGTKEIQVVYNEKDGYYHLETADGPVLYVRINQSTKYLDALKGIVALTNIGKYFYDDDGKLIKKESYVDAIYIDKSLQPNNTNKYYSAVADKKYGVVPLTSELIYILKNSGEGGWYDINSPDYIFDNAALPVQVLPQNAWLFAVVYFD